jgi:hypothetical protein
VTYGSLEPHHPALPPENLTFMIGQAKILYNSIEKNGNSNQADSMEEH